MAKKGDFIIDIIVTKVKSFLKEYDYFKSRLIFLAGLGAALIAAIVLMLVSVNTFIINDGTHRFKVRVLNGGIASAAYVLGLNEDDYEVLNTFNGKSGTVAEIERKFPVTVTSGKKIMTVKTVKTTVKDVLSLAGITVDEFDMVEPSLDTVLTKKCSIDFIDIDYISEECTEIVPYDVKTVYTSALPCGNTTVKEGSNGVKLVNYVKKFVNGVEVEKAVQSEKILTPAVGCVKTVGTKGNASITTGVAVTTSNYASCYSTLSPASAVPLDENGVPTNYTGHITVTATAYTHTGHRTATGHTPQPGYVAVNPNIIPYGTRMYIVSSDGNWVYGYAEAADTGGFAYSNPTNIDLFFNTYAQCIAFGRRNIEVYFLP